MEFSSSIKFSNNLTKNGNTTITYSGFLFQNNSDSVTMVYGFGDNWSNTTEQEMEKQEDGFVANIKLLDFNRLNFCFRNSNYEWDNNNSQNYIVPIAEQEIEETFILNENIINDILDHLFAQNIEEIHEISSDAVTDIANNTIELIENDVINEENIEIDIEKVEPITIEETLGNISEDFDMNSLVDEILSSISNFDSNQEENFEVSKNVQNFDETSEQTETRVQSLNVTNVQVETGVQDFDLTADQIENSGMEDVSESEDVQEESLLEGLNETTALTTVKESDNYLVSPRSLSKFYMIKKKIKLAFYKLFVAIPKILSSSFNEENNK